MAEYTPEEIEAMSSDEYAEKVLNQTQGTDESQDQEVVEVEETATDETIESEEEVVEDQETDTEELETQEDTKQESNISNKSSEELALMLAQSQTMISQQGNTIGELQKQMLEMSKKPTEPVVTVDDKLKDYDPKDVETIKELVRSELVQKEKQKSQQEQIIKEANKYSNEQAWQNIIEVEGQNSKLANAIVEEIKKDPQLLYAKDYVTKAIIQNAIKNPQSTTPSQATTKKKRMAVTASGGASRAKEDSLKNKPDDELTSEEYRIKHSIPVVR